MTEFMVVTAAGTHREIGRQIGEGAREAIRRALARYREHAAVLLGMSFAEAEGHALACLPFAGRVLPGIVEELQGMAEGAAVPFTDLLVANCGEELEDLAARRKSLADETTGPTHCTTLVLARDGRCVLGHNEDWWRVDMENNVFVDVTTVDGTRFLSLNAACYLATTGINSHGVAAAAETVSSIDGRPGVPNLFVCRSMLEAATADDAVRRATIADRTVGGAHVIVDGRGSIRVVEVSGSRRAVREAEESLVHTNHYLEAPMKEVGQPPSQGSLARWTRAREMLAAHAGGSPVDTVMKVLRDHTNSPDSICGHGRSGGADVADTVTTSSVVWETSERVMWAGAGQPCQSGYRRFQV